MHQPRIASLIISLCIIFLPKDPASDLDLLFSPRPPGEGSTPGFSHLCFPAIIPRFLTVVN
jgi:hypothetical protein